MIAGVCASRRMNTRDVHRGKSAQGRDVAVDLTFEVECHPFVLSTKAVKGLGRQTRETAIPRVNSPWELIRVCGPRRGGESLRWGDGGGLTGAPEVRRSMLWGRPKAADTSHTGLPNQFPSAGITTPGFPGTPTDRSGLISGEVVGSGRPGHGGPSRVLAQYSTRKSGESWSGGKRCRSSAAASIHRTASSAAGARRSNSGAGNGSTRPPCQ